MGMGAAGLLVQLASDKDVHSLIKKVGFRMIKIKNKFDLGNEHATVLGLTQHGKTYGTIKTLEQMKESILFFNSQHTSVGNGWIEANGGNTVEQIIYALNNGHKINYLPADDNLDKMSVQLGAITERIYKEGKMNIRFVIDEVQLFDMAKNKAGKNALLRLATTGLGRGFKCVFLSQRPAKVDNTLYTQSTKHIIFALGKLDESYLKTNGFPVDEIIQRTKNEKYVFIEFDQKEIRGGFKIG
jgi:hypothetical protein